ncbi:MAG: FAD-binding oxidoreductase, partial [Acidobacteriota bacterium]|nr:FAD-binding oxidoreductase [Acidobacteriota bacterium]
DGCALLDLGRMKKIVDFHEERAYVTVEPGVSQQDLHNFLRRRKSKLWMDATGSSPECSLIGNAAERGFGHTPYGDHFNHVCGLEVVLANGDYMETGFGRFPNAVAAPLYRWGVGPYLDGLFSQSNFGIITRMTVWLMPRPEYFQAFFFRCDTQEEFGRVVDALRPLRLDGTLRSAVHIGNDYKVLAGMQNYPWEETQGQTPLSTVVMERLRQQLNIGCWNGSGALYGTRNQVTEARRLLRRALSRKISKLQFLDEKRLRVAGRFARGYRLATGWDIRRTIELARPIFGLMRGVPTSHSIASAYWRKPSPAPKDMDPDRDRCGLLWAAPVLPIDGRLALAFAREISAVMLSHGFEPLISMTLLTERTLSCIISITYDRDLPGEDQKAMECYRAVMDLASQRGYYSYRLGIQSMDAGIGQGGYNRFVETLKRAIDPDGVLAPGRYDPLHRASERARDQEKVKMGRR